MSEELKIHMLIFCCQQSILNSTEKHDESEYHHHLTVHCSIATCSVPPPCHLQSVQEAEATVLCPRDQVLSAEPSHRQPASRHRHPEPGPAGEADAEVAST